MLVVPPGDDPRSSCRGSRSRAARGRQLADAGRDRDLGRDRRPVRRSSPARRRDRAGAGVAPVGVSDRLWAAPPAAPPGGPPGRRFELGDRGPSRRSGWSRTPTRSTLLRLAAQAADRVVDQIAAGPARRPDRGRRRPRGPRAARRRGPRRRRDSRSSRSGPNSASPHHEASERVIRAGEPIVLDIGGTLGGYGSATSPGPCGSPAATRRTGPDEEFRHLFGVLSRPRRRRRAAVRPGVACEAIDAAARDVIDGRGLRRGVLPSDRARHRPRGPRGAVPGRRQRPSRWREGMAFSVEPGIYLAGPVRRPDRGHRRLRRRRPDRAQRRADREPPSSTAEPAPGTLGYHPRNGGRKAHQRRHRTDDDSTFWTRWRSPPGPRGSPTRRGAADEPPPPRRTPARANGHATLRRRSPRRRRRPAHRLRPALAPPSVQPTPPVRQPPPATAVDHARRSRSPHRSMRRRPPRCRTARSRPRRPSHDRRRRALRDGAPPARRPAARRPSSGASSRAGPTCRCTSSVAGSGSTAARTT